MFFSWEKFLVCIVTWATRSDATWRAWLFQWENLFVIYVPGKEVGGVASARGFFHSNAECSAVHSPSVKRRWLGSTLEDSNSGCVNGCLVSYSATQLMALQVIRLNDQPGNMKPCSRNEP